MAAQIIEGVLESVMSAVTPVTTEEGPSSRGIAAATAEMNSSATRRHRMSAETEIKVVEIDCTEPEIRISPRRRSVVSQVRLCPQVGPLK